MLEIYTYFYSPITKCRREIDNQIEILVIYFVGFWRQLVVLQIHDCPPERRDHSAQRQNAAVVIATRVYK